MHDDYSKATTRRPIDPRRFVLLIVWGALVHPANAQLPAFPGAEGEGRFTTGGRGGDVYHVTNLNDLGAGSLRHGLATAFNGPRTIVFDIGGTIALSSDLNVTNGNITIAGETAPGKGIAITNYGLGINAPNVIMRHIRVRPGDAKKGSGAEHGFNGDAISISRSDVILDHVSASWGIDENLSVAGNGTRRVTIQFSTISEGLAQTGLHHGEYNANYSPGGPDSHSMGSLIKPGDGNGIISMHHNLWSNNGNRNPAIGNYSDDHTMRVDIRNNVLYNNRSNGYATGESERIELNYVGNYVIAGPNTSAGNRTVGFRAEAPNNLRIYSLINRVDGNRNGLLDGVLAPASLIQGTFTTSGSPFSLAPITTDSAIDAYWKVANSAGAFYWNRDDVDARLVSELLTQRGQIINSQNDIGGYPLLSTVMRPNNWDTDGDGMPDAWERKVDGLNPLLADNNGDLNSNGYTNLEEYLHFRAQGLNVPEPATVHLMLTSLLALLSLRRFRVIGGAALRIYDCQK
ncbi:MAG: PEP-CTERM sorting domain-containing protein [Pirellulales bacterium]